MAEISSRKHWTVAASVLLIDAALVASTIILDKTHPREPPVGGSTDTAAVIGWLGVLGAIVIFGCYGILIKTPAVVQAQVDTMIFTVYYGVGTAFVSLLIWAIAGSHAGLTLNGSSFSMGLLFGFVWTTSQIFVYTGVQTLGYAVGSAIWIGITICVSFVWGTLVFSNPVVNVPGAIGALVLLLTGVCLAAGSSYWSTQRQERLCAQEMDLQSHLSGATRLNSPGVFGVFTEESRKELQSSRQDQDLVVGARGTGSGRAPAGGSAIVGLVSCIIVGFLNGSLMVPMNCFQQGCDSIDIRAYEGSALAPLAFLPSLALGILTVLPVIFVIYFWRTLLVARRLPNFHFSVVALPGSLTGMFWGMGNFNAMFATVYLGQTIGYPLTQCCLILTGAWGIVYYKEIQGAKPIGLFIFAAIVLLVGAALDGLYG